MTEAARFWSRVHKGAPDACWQWGGCILSNGYGTVYFGRRNTSAHRVAFSLAKGPIRSGLFVCHSCDNRSCVNPRHLWLGTARDNIRDCHAKGRNADFRGPKSSSAKLTWEKVREIRRLRDEAGLSYYELAANYGVDHTAIYKIVHNKRWKV